MRNPDHSALRFAASFALALVVVLGMLVIGLRISGFMEQGEARALNLQEVQVLSERERRDFTELLGEGTGSRLSTLLPLEQIPPLKMSREIQGFVQLEVIVAEDGSVRDVRVLNATPAGVYDETAMAQVRSRHYSPDLQDGQPVVTRMLEIIDFSLSEAELGALME